MVETDVTGAYARTGRRQAEGHDPVPNTIMNWLTLKGKPGSTRVHLAAATNGLLGQIVISSFDEYDNNMGDEVIEVSTLDHLMAA